jgi:hypothetical protein
MKLLRFDRLTREIGLVLISSSLVLGGCSHPCDNRPPDGQAVPGQPRADCRGGHGGGHVGHVPAGGHGVVVVPGAGGGARAPAAGSGRGGFGATGHATAGG